MAVAMKLRFWTMAHDGDGPSSCEDLQQSQREFLAVIPNHAVAAVKALALK